MTFIKEPPLVNQVFTRLTNEDYEALQEIVEANDVKLSVVIRKACLLLIAREKKGKRS